MLAIAAPSFNEPSETFIRNHVLTIAPGQTVLLCHDGAETDTLDCPVLSDIDPWQPAETFSERVANAVRQRWRIYIDPSLRGEAGKRVVAFLRAHKAAAVLAEYGPMGCLLSDVCRKADVPLFVHFHGYDASLLLQQPHQVRHYRRLFRLATGIIAPSSFLAAKLASIGCPSDKLHVSPHGIDLNRFRRTSRVPGLIVAVGRLVEKKAPNRTIEAFARIAGKFPEARLEIVGDGPLRNLCEALITKTGLGSRIILHGAQDNDRIVTLLQRASLFAQHSVTAANGDTESFGISLIEAMAAEVPVVITRHNGFVDTVEHGVSGFLVAEHDVDGMADAMAVLLSDPARAAAMGAAGRARVLERFTAEHARDRLRAIMGLPPACAATSEPTRQLRTMPCG